MKSGSESWNPASNPAHAAALARLLQNPATATPEFETELAGEALRRTRAFIAGVQRYQTSPISRDVAEAPIIAKRGHVVLRDYNPYEPQAPVVFVIPSLINRCDILDLDKNHSFLRSLAKAGFRPLVVDWGIPGREEEDFSLGDYITQRLLPLFDGACGAPAHIIGYCMGGLLALALATHRQAQTKTLSLLATPWDFHKPDAAIGMMLTKLAHDAGGRDAFSSPLAVDALQAFFASLQPMQALKKFADFATLDDADEERRFVLLEDWLNDGVPLAAPSAKECVEDWYGKNLTAQNKWKVGGKIIDPAQLTMPSYCLVPGQDRIVPPESALPLAKLLPHHTLHEPMTGHIGMMASTKAPHQVWVPFLRWMAEHR